MKTLAVIVEIPVLEMPEPWPVPSPFGTHHDQHVHTLHCFLHRSRRRLSGPREVEALLRYDVDMIRVVG